MIHRTPFDDMPVLNPPQPTHEATIPGVAPPAQPEPTIVPSPENAAPANDASAAFNPQNWNSHGGVPEVHDGASMHRTSSRDFKAYQDQRFAVEMWPHSPQYTGRR